MKFDLYCIKMNGKFLHIVIAVFLVSVIEIEAKFAPAYIKPCPGFPNVNSECLTKTIQEVIPEFVKGNSALGLNATDPLYQEKVDLVLPGGFKILFYDGFSTGFKKCVVDSAKLEKNVADINLHCNITIKGKYQAAGRVLIVTINGDGDVKVKAKNVILNAKIMFQDKTRDGKVFYEVKNFAVKHRFEDKVAFVVTNLFKGSPLLSESVLQFLNDNWKQVAEEFGKPVVDKLVDLVFTVIKQFFVKIPKDELF